MDPFEFPGMVELKIMTVPMVGTSGGARELLIKMPAGKLPDRESMVEAIRESLDAIGAEGYRLASAEEFNEALLRELHQLKR